MKTTPETVWADTSAILKKRRLHALSNEIASLIDDIENNETSTAPTLKEISVKLREFRDEVIDLQLSLK